MLSIIIPVKDQLHWTKHIIQDIKKKVTVPHEVIVVDDGSQPDTFEWLNSRLDDGVSLAIRNEVRGVNAAWNLGVNKALGDIVWIINNDIVLTEGLDRELIGVLDKHKIACPWTTEGKVKFMLPLARKSDDLSGWCFMMKKKDWKPIEPRLDLWYGDTWQYAMNGKDVGYIGKIHHYVSKTIFSPEEQKKNRIRILQDKVNWQIIKNELNLNCHD